MAEKKSKYSALGEIAKTPAAPVGEQETPHPENAPPSPSETALTLPVKTAKPQGKRSNPDWKQYSVLLKKESHKEAVALLRDRYEGTDISDLMQALLEQWLKSQ